MLEELLLLLDEELPEEDELEVGITTGVVEHDVQVVALLQLLH